jgi:ribosomal protein S18 acetylase RimI-like enzyme
MCVDPSAKGKRFAAYVLSWACGYAAAAGKKYVRMDTWKENPGLIDYYISCGFRRTGSRQLRAVPNLPPHYSHLHLALFQNEI